MKLRVNYRMIWKFNALLIFFAGIGVCLGLVYFAWALLHDYFGLYRRDEVVKGETAISEDWRLGSFERLGSSDYMMAPVSSTQEYSGVFMEKEATAIRNYLFVNVRDKSSRWLVPNNDRVILMMKRYGTEGESGVPEDRPAKWLVFHVVTVDTDGDKRLTELDRKTIAVANADGSQYVEVLGNVDILLGETWTAGDKLLVVYSADGKNHISEIGLESRSVSDAKDLPKLGP